ncbi:MAG: sensor histidine kinase [Candidatus Nanopelagicales bacterium]
MAAEVDTRDFAERTVVGWHVLFGLMVVVTSAFLIADGNAWPGLALLLILVVGYVVLAGPGARCGDWRRYAYIALAIGVLAILTWIDPASLVLLFALYPQCFLLLERRASIVAVVAMTVVWNLELIAMDGWSLQSWGIHSVTSIGNIMFALVIGLFIDGLVRESRQRKALLAELHEAQAELAAAEREAGALGERERIARDIHDTLAQGFTSIVMLSQAAEAAAGSGDDAAVAARLTEIQRTARENLAEARALVGAMSPPALEGAGLPDALARLTSRADLGVPVELRVEGEPRPLSSTSEVAALRATQEAVSNATRHSGAQHVEVVLGYDEDGATITVTDDGSGFDTTAPPTGYGLTGIVARVEEVGGIAVVESAPGEGTKVRVRVP